MNVWIVLPLSTAMDDSVVVRNPVKVINLLGFRANDSFICLSNKH